MTPPPNRRVIKKPRFLMRANNSSRQPCSTLSLGASPFPCSAYSFRWLSRYSAYVEFYVYYRGSQTRLTGMKRCPSCQSVFPTHYTHCPRDGSALAESAEWSGGTIIRGKYQIIGKVGQGGMAAVYKAVHVRFKELRALKVINPELADDASFVRRFEQEAIITRKLQHPNAVRVDDIDEAEDGRPFIVMEYVDGRSLKDVIEQQAPLSVERVCSIVKQVAAALDSAHRLGLVHRDIKPANIALVASGDRSDPSSDRVKVLDFGIAKLKEAHLEDSRVRHETLTGTGMVIGTPAYMSPEQARGLKGEQLDGRSDLYSLGVVAYQMLTGDLPLKADSTVELLMAHISMTPRPIQEVQPELGIPDTVAGVVMRCLEKNRDLRPASGRALIEEIEFAGGRAGLPIQTVAAMTNRQIAHARNAELPAPQARDRQNAERRLLSWWWAAVTVLIVGGVGLGWYLTPKPRYRVSGAQVTSRPSEPNPTQPSQTRSASLPPESSDNGRAPAPNRTKPRVPEPVRVASQREAQNSVSNEPKSNPIAATPMLKVEPSASPPPTTLHTTPFKDNSASLAILAITGAAGRSDVFIDGAPLGTTSATGNLQVPVLTTGEHRIRVSHDGFEDYQQSILFVPGETFQVHAVMNRIATQGTDTQGAAYETPSAKSSPSITEGASATIAVLAVSGKPGNCDVFIDGARAATTSGKGYLQISVSYGEHTVRISHWGFKDYEQGMLFTAGETTQVHVNLTQAPR